MRVSDLTRPKPTEATIDLGDGDTIVLTFDRNRVTPAWITLAARRDDEKDTLSLPKALADVIMSWDVTDDNGAPFPPTPDNLAVFSYPAQRDLLTRIMQQAVPGEAEGKALSVPTSTVPSASTQPPPTSPNGQVTSQLPEPSASPSPT
jgi:hypothetical protein